MARVALGVPSNGTWCTGFGTSLAKLCNYTQHEVVLLSMIGSSLSTLRTRMVRQALEAECSHLLFLDTDMVFPPQTLDWLLERGEKVVAGNCPVKMVPSQPTARRWNGDHYAPVFTLPESRGLEQVDRVGTGVMLLDLSIFNTVKEPWFSFRWCGPGEEYQGEDWCLCEGVEDAGFPIFVDHDLSKEIGHIGYFTYTHKLVKPEMLKHDGRRGHRRWEDLGAEK